MDASRIETEGLVVEAPHKGFNMVPVVLEDMRPDEVLVEMRYSGICHTDIGASIGGYSALTYPAVPGHEGAGVIRALGAEVSDPSLKVGGSVILSFNHCRVCRNCLSNHPACCSNFEALNISGSRLDGSSPGRLRDGRSVVTQFFGQSSFLKHSIVSQASVVSCPYPDDLLLYASLGCGFQTGAGTILNSLKPSKNDSIVIFGAGTVGLAAVMAAKVLGLDQIIVVDIVPEKLALARELGATHLIDSTAVSDIGRECRELTGGGAQYVLECTGVSAVIDSILDCACCGGTAAVIGSPRPEFVLAIDPEKLLHENKTLRGICQGDSIAKKFIPEMMELHRAGVFPLEKLLTTYDIKDLTSAISDVLDGKTIKAILRWS